MDYNYTEWGIKQVETQVPNELNTKQKEEKQIWFNTNKVSHCFIKELTIISSVTS